jgi:Zn-finger nucleic acid-binding protein
MKCPTDGTTLTMSERGGIEIDYCPECRGVWLDRGELDKIIERSTTQPPPAPAAPAAPAPPASSYEQERDYRRMQQDQRYAQASQQPYRKKKKESWLSEIFD